jgi:hypothetical protein
MDNRERFRDLVARADITLNRSAELIAEQTMRPCALRTVQSWLAEPGSKSARPCPDWAVVALRVKLELLQLIKFD